MTNDTARAAAGETRAGLNPKTGRNPRPTPPTRRVAPALPDPIDAHDVLERAEAIGIHWWSVIDGVLETHRYHMSIHPQPLDPLPQWAVERLKDQGRHSDSYQEFSQKCCTLGEWLHLAAGDGSQYRFEVWDANNSRLAIRQESLEEAAATLDRLKPLHPSAFVTRVHVKSAQCWPTDPALLNTLIGKVQHIGTSFLGEEDQFTVQDATGRQVTVLASVLRAHSVYKQLSARGKEALDCYLNEEKARKAALRKAAAAAKKAGSKP